MNSVEVMYGGTVYKIVGRTVEEVQLQIAVILADENAGWIEVRDSFGNREPYLLLVTRGVPIALSAISAS